MTVWLDTLVPTPAARTRHAVEVAAPPERVWEALRAQRPFDLWLVRALFAVRTLSLRRGPSLSLADGLRRSGFVELPAGEGAWVIGTAGRFWRRDGGLVRLSTAEHFQAYREPGSSRATLAFAVEPAGEGRSRLVTETRVETFGDDARRDFGRYWTAVGPFSGLLRRALLRAVRKSAERS